MEVVVVSREDEDLKKNTKDIQLLLSGHVAFRYTLETLKSSSLGAENPWALTGVVMVRSSALHKLSNEGFDRFIIFLYIAFIFTQAK